MPNRVLRDWTNSERFDELSTEAEVFFTRLIMKADDFGGFYGNTKLLKSNLYPLKDFSHKKILKWIEECVNIGIIIYYEVDGKNYVRINDFGQRTRIMKSKFPDPEECSRTNDGQLPDNSQTDDGLKPKPNQTETETKPKQNPKSVKIPTLEEFLSHIESKYKDLNKEFEPYRFAAETKYNVWKDDDWKDGNGKPIKNWKNKANTAIQYFKPIYNGKFNAPKSRDEINREANDAREREVLARLRGEDPNSDQENGLDANETFSEEFTDWTDVTGRSDT